MNELTNKMNYLISKLIDPNLANQNQNQNNNSNNNSNNNNNNNTNPLSSRDNEKPKLKYKHWCSTVEKKISAIGSLVPILETNLLGSSEEKKKEKAITTFHKMSAFLSELNPLLEISTYKPRNKSIIELNSNNNHHNNESDSPPTSGFQPSSSTSPNTSFGNLANALTNNNNSASTTTSSTSTITTTTASNNININIKEKDTTVTVTPLSMSPSSSSENNGTTNGNGLISTYKELTNSGGIKESNSTSSSGLRSTKAITYSCRDAMLQLWSQLLAFVEKYHNIEKDLTPVYQCILLICRRREFDSSVSLTDPITQRAWSLSPTEILSKYRKMLHKTFSFVATILSSPLFFSIPLTHFCSKFLSVAFFRIPKVARIILEALTPPETEIQDIISHFPIPPHLKHLQIVGDRPDKSPFHICLMQMGLNNSINNSSNNNSNNININNINSNSNNINLNNNINNINNNNIGEDLLIESLSQGWVDNLARKESVFFIFFKDWFTSCKYVLGETIDMKTVPGFFTLTYALLHEIKTRDQAPPPLSKPTPSLDAQFTLIQACRSDNIIDVMMKTIFLKTCVFDLPVVSTTLSLVESWLKEYGPLSDSFDINFFCEGIESIIIADHHQILIRALQMLYNTSECFQRNLRKVLFSDLLLDKYFYPLFLHWDQPVRNAYHHLLLYKMVRINRSKLYESGASLQEFSKLTHNTPTIVTKSSALSPAKYIDSKDDNHNYSSSSRINTSSLSSSIGSNSGGSVRQTNGTSSLSSSAGNTSKSISIGRKVPPPVPKRNFNDNSPTSPSNSPPKHSSTLSTLISSTSSINIESEDSFVIIESSNENLNNHNHNNTANNTTNIEGTATTSITMTASNSPSLIATPSDSNNQPSSSITSPTITSPSTSGSANGKDQTKKPLPKLPLSAISEKFNKEYSLDIKLFFEIEVLTKKVQDQMRCPELKFHDPILSHYVASSISEFKTYIAHSNQVDSIPPKIIPLMFANSNHIINYKD